MACVPRYLVSFDARRSNHYFADVLIIGAGIAGLRAALEIPQNLHVLVVTKGEIALSNSAMAQGGIAGVMAEDDRFENHIEDTLNAGCGLCDERVVEKVVREAPGEICRLIEWGTRFDEEGGVIALTREGGHSHRRIVHALGDATGHEVMRALIANVRSRENVTIWENAFTVDLLTEEGRCVGAVIHRRDLGPVLVWAQETILAAGGAGMVYRETTNPPVATGDGIAAAWRAGAEIRDMEFMQFHPTVLYVAGSSRFLISEAVRGEGAYLRDKFGHRFMPQVDSRAELAPRDIVARAIFERMEQTRHPCVFLDLSHLDPAMVRRRFPGIAKVCQQFGLDITRDQIPIRPGAHYLIGGVTVDLDARTSLPGLWAAGEVTSSGLHGANRLASNSLLEGLVFGAAAARGAMIAVERTPRELRAAPLHHERDHAAGDEVDLVDIRNSLRSLMVRNMGVVRQGELLDEAYEQVAFWRRYVLAREFQHVMGWELQNMLLVAQAMIRNARMRNESRGVHFRCDYPRRDDEHWRRHLTCPPINSL